MPLSHAAEESLQTVESPAANPRFTGAPFVRTWTEDDYTASPVNYAVLQHPRNGFIYAGNNYGVLEYGHLRHPRRRTSVRQPSSP